MPPVICPACGHENPVGALVCAHCDTLLAHVDRDTRALPTESLDDIEMSAPQRQFTKHLGLLGPDAVALYVNDIDDPLIVHITRQAALGRYSTQNTTQPRIDLTDYGAFEKGVSRIHAVLQRTDDGLTIEDLNSNNGSWLNNARLAPNDPQLLHSGDRLQLGEIFIEIYF
ncbi:MAG: FHA domain-containing protein [Chloroflexota bacterium]